MKHIFTYRQLVPGDYQALRIMWEASPGLCIRQADTYKGFSFFLDRNPGLSFAVEVSGQVVGGILGGHDGRFGFIHHLVVLPQFQKQGAGRQLVEHCLEQIKAVGVEKCHIFINHDNSDGFKFWERIGWKERTELTMASFTFDLLSS